MRRTLLPGLFDERRLQRGARTGERAPLRDRHALPRSREREPAQGAPEHRRRAVRRVGATSPGTRSTPPCASSTVKGYRRGAPGPAACGEGCASVRGRGARGYAFLQPGRGAEVLAGGTVLGWGGRDSPPRCAERYDIALPVGGIRAQPRRPSCAPAPRAIRVPYAGFSTYRAVDVDLAIVVDESVTYETLVQRLTSAGGKLLRGRAPVRRVPRRCARGRGQESRWRLPSPTARDDHTLTSDEVERVHGKLVEKVCRAVGGEVRSLSTVSVAPRDLLRALHAPRRLRRG